MWRRTRPWSHAPGRCTSDEFDQPYDANKSNEPDDLNDTDDTDDTDELHYSYDSHDSGQ